MHSLTTIKSKTLTELTYQTDVIDGICQRCQEHVCWLGFSPTCIARKGSLVSRHFPCSSATQSFKTVQLVLTAQSRENILQEIKSEENNIRGGALWFGYEAGRKHTSMAVKLHFFFHTRYDLFATAVQEEAAVPDGMSSAVSCQSVFSVTPSFSLAQCFMALSSFGHIYMSCGARCKVFQASKIQANSEAENAAPESCRQTHQSQLV